MKRKKLFYVPGLISIIGLPILLFFWSPEDRPYLTCLKINLPTDKKDSGEILRFSKDGFFRLIKNKKLITIDLGGGSPYIVDIKKYPLTDRKFQFVTRAIEQMQFTNETSTVLKIELDEGNTYGEFVWLFDQAIIYEIKRFALIDNDFYFLANPPVERYPAETLTLEPGPEISINWTGPTKWELFKRDMEYKLEEAKYMIRRSPALTTGLLLLIIIPEVIGIKKQLRSNRSNRPVYMRNGPGMEGGDADQL